MWTAVLALRQRVQYHLVVIIVSGDAILSAASEDALLIVNLLLLLDFDLNLICANRLLI